MHWKQSYHKKNLIGIDALSLILSLFTAIYIKHQAFIFPSSIIDFLFLGLLMGIWFLSAHECRLYRNRIYKKFTEEILFNFYANAVFVILLSAFLFLTKSNYANLFRFSILVSLHFSISILAKYYIRKKQHLAFEGGALNDAVIIVGYNKTSLEFFKTLNEHIYYGYKCLGFIYDEDVIEQDSVEGMHYLGKIRDLENALKAQHIDEVIISLPSEKNWEIRYCAEICDQLNVRVRLMPAIYDLTTKSEEIDNLGLLSVNILNELP
jgi:FlaA1/EpsC-like NDP-sugar epimerase